jgi:hypothetical protein
MTGGAAVPVDPDKLTRKFKALQNYARRVDTECSATVRCHERRTHDVTAGTPGTEHHFSGGYCANPAHAALVVKRAQRLSGWPTVKVTPAANAPPPPPEQQALI